MQFLKSILMKHWLLLLCSLLLASMVILFLVSNFYLSMTRREIEIEGLPQSFDGMRILHLSDLHSSSYGKNNETCAQMIVDADPDVIFVTGDVSDKNKLKGDPFLQLLDQLDGRVPIYLSLGNHELYFKKKSFQGYARFMKTIRSHGVVLLNNQSVLLKRGGEAVRLYGLNPPVNTYYGKKELGDISIYLGEKDPEHIALLLAHDPQWFEKYVQWGADLVFSGHVHGGMVRLPFIGGLYSPTRTILPKYDAGLFSQDGSQMTVSRGAGDTRMLRFGSIPEITLITLHAKT